MSTFVVIPTFSAVTFDSDYLLNYCLRPPLETKVSPFVLTLSFL